MRTSRLVLVVLVVAAFAIPVAPAAAEIAAQFDYATVSSSEGWWEAFWANYIVAQTFIPTISGTVTSIEAPVDTRSSGYTGDIPISFEIRTVWDSGLNGIQPDRRAGVLPLSTGSVSASTPLANDALTNWVNIAMTPCELQAGQTYAIVASALGTDQAYYWYSRGYTSQYADGIEYCGYNGDANLGRQLTSDLAFRVNVAVPEPGSLLALGSGLIGMLAFRRRKK